MCMCARIVHDAPVSLKTPRTGYKVMAFKDGCYHPVFFIYPGCIIGEWVEAQDTDKLCHTWWDTRSYRRGFHVYRVLVDAQEWYESAYIGRWIREGGIDLRVVKVEYDGVLAEGTISICDNGPVDVAIRMRIVEEEPKFPHENKTG